MKPVAAILLLFALAVNCRPAETQHKWTTPIQQEFAGLDVDSRGNPTNLVQAYAQGQAKARRDLTNGLVVIKTAGLLSPEGITYEDMVKRRCHVRWDGMGGCCVSGGVAQYMKGYNEISCAYIQQKYGTNIFTELENEVEIKTYGNPVKPPSALPAPPNAYIVCEGDTLGKIARKKGVTLKHLLAANPNIVPAKLQIGQQITLPSDNSNSVPKSPPAAN